MAGLPPIKKRIVLLLATLLLVASLGAQTVKAENQSSDPRIITYVVPAITDEKILPTSSIPDEYISDEISLRACPGEYEPASFVIRANEDITSLEAEATELIGESGSIPSSNVDIRVVKCWYQAGVGVWDITHKLLTPELLLKDDSLVKVEDGENYLKLTTGEYVWISEVKSGTGEEIIPIEELPVKDSSTLQAVNIPQGTNKQFWVTVKIPEDASPGSYSGTIKLETPGEGVMAELQLTLEVLPIQLSKPYLTYSIYYLGKLDPSWPEGTISSGPKSEAQMRAELENMFNHGVTSPTICQYTLDETLLGKLLAMRDEAGMSGQPLYLVDISTSIPNNTIATIIAFADSYGIPEVYFYGMDEPTETTQLRDYCNRIHGVGGKVFVAVNNQIVAEGIADVLDLVIRSRDVTPALVTLYHSYGHELFSYANPQVGPELPETFRRNYGLLLWQKGCDGAMDFAYQWSACNIWNDFDDNDYRDHNFAYPTQDGVIDTIQWEGWREGVDDVRYLTTLLELIEEAKAEGKDASDAENWLADLKSSNLATKDLDAVRSEMIGYILSFLGGTPSDTTPPVITSIAASNITGASATISWSTNEPATSQVEYGTTEDLGLSSDLDTTLVTNHSVSLTDLANSTTYHYKVKSRDAAGNLAAGEVYNFTTLSPYLSISFIPPTDADNSVVDRNWTEINTSIDGTFGVSSFIDWDRSLVGYWNFNENSGNTANDKSTYSNNGTLINGPQWTTGKFGNALNFDGETDYVEVADSNSLDISDAITIDVRVKPLEASNSNNMSIFVSKKGAYPVFGIRNDQYTYFYLTGVYDWYYKSTKNYFDGDWHHIVATYDANGGSNNMRIYIDGELDNSITKTGTISTSDYNLRIGHFEGSGYYLKGTIDDVRIYNRALSPEEIIASYNTNLHSLSHKFTNLADGTYEYYAYATDLSGNSAETETRTLIIDTITASPGDANGDGIINALDITKVKRVILGVDAETPGADVNQDGKINALDITALEKLIMEQTPQ